MLNDILSFSSGFQKGQDTPIQVLRNGGGKLHLVAGAHRLEACKRISVEVRAEIIECSELEARLIKIDENLFRRELGALDRAVFLAERKAVYEEMYPDTKKGGDRGNQHSGGKPRLNGMLTFSQETGNGHFVLFPIYSGQSWFKRAEYPPGYQHSGGKPRLNEKISFSKRRERFSANNKFDVCKVI